MSKPEKLKRVVIKEELVALTDDHIAALALCQFLYWSERRNDFDKFILEEKQRQPELNADLTHGWIYKSIEELHTELMLKSLSPSTLRRRVETLIERGWIDRRRNPQFKWDKTWQYRPNIFKIQRDLFELGYSLEGYPLQFDKSILQGGKSNVQDETSNLQGETALPEITSEITKQERENKDIEETGNFLQQTKKPDRERIQDVLYDILRDGVPPPAPKQQKAFENAVDTLTLEFKELHGYTRKQPLDHNLTSKIIEAIRRAYAEKGKVYPFNGNRSPNTPIIDAIVDAGIEVEDKSTAADSWAEQAELSQQALAERQAEPPNEVDCAWARARILLEPDMDTATFRHLFRDSYLVSLDPAVLVVRSDVQEMLEFRWADRVADALGVEAVQFRIASGS